MDHVNYCYMKGTPYEKKAVDDVSLEIKNGEFVGIIGHTGSGKSTLIQHINGLLLPDSGKVTVNGVELARKGGSLNKIRQQVGLVFQYPEHQLFEETVYKDIAFGPANQGLTEDEISVRVRESIEAVGLEEDILFKSPFELSGGQKRRVAIAGVLAMEPSVLVLDEPTAGLDPKGRSDFLAKLEELHNKRRITVILISHSMEDIARLVDRIIVMNKGKIQMDGCPAAIFSEPDVLENMGLTVPQITNLMKRLKGIHKEISDGIFTVRDAKAEILKMLNRGNEST